MGTSIKDKISLIRKFGLLHRDAMALFELNPPSDLIKLSISSSLLPIIEWLENVTDNNNFSDDQRINAACLINSIKFTDEVDTLSDSIDTAIKSEESYTSPYEEHLDIYGDPIDKEKYSVFKKEKEIIENYSEEYLLNTMEQYIDTKSIQDWDLGKKLYRGRIISEIYDLLHIYNFSWELDERVQTKIHNIFETVWSKIESKRENYELNHLDEWFDSYSKWMTKHGAKKSTKSNITDFFKTISEVKMKSTTIDTIKNRYNAK